MTDPSTGSALVTVHRPDGTERQLKKLGPADWMRLENTLRSSRKGTRRNELLAENADADAIKAAMAKIDAQPIKYLDVENFLNTVTGQYAAIMLSLQKDRPGDTAAAIEADFEALAISPADWMRLTAKLCNLEVITTAPEGGAGTPLPTGAAPGPSSSGATTNPTGGQPPSSSNATSTSPTTP